MILLPLHSLLNIPSDGLTIVVDNAISPQESVSFRTHSRQQKRQRRPSPADNYTEGCRWSAIPPPPLVTSEDAMDPCSAGSFLRASAFHEMDSCSTPASDPLRAPVRQKSDNDLLVNKKADASTRPSLSKENPKLKSTTATRCSSSTLKIPVRKVSSDALVEQSTLRRSAPCSSGSQMNFQWDDVQTATNCLAMKRNPLLQKTSPHLEFVPALSRQEFHGMTISELIQKAIEEVSNQ